jgi:hypothetical protein
MTRKTVLATTTEIDDDQKLDMDRNYTGTENSLGPWTAPSIAGESSIRGGGLALCSGNSHTAHHT